MEPEIKLMHKVCLKTKKKKKTEKKKGMIRVFLFLVPLDLILRKCLNRKEMESSR